ncbi:sensor histidine kinase [Cellulomonas soli]|uniref:histidine kinase n=1 Tax=Cellulomonas soli TaxID=931535 RepID=A0A512PA07_9CELL|nr:sensor histidine kinase [Cellulomonas soli]NYI60515.1 signal transduction histidine kinase [Cellulomonas soli]GEP68030.1 histidine kinase [Cellulomonas soli]
MSRTSPPAPSDRFDGSDSVGSAGSAGKAVGEPAALEPTSGAVVHRRQTAPFWSAPFARRTWQEFGYLWVALLLSPVGFTYAVFTVSFTAGIAVTVVGLFLGGWLVLGARGWGAAFRGLGRGLLAVDVPAPAPHVARRGFWRRLGGLLGDAPGWRALAFVTAAFPLAIVAFTVSVTFLAVALGGMTHWYWSRWLPAQQAPDGSWHRGTQLGTGWFVDTTPRQVALAALGVLFALLWAQVTLAMGHLFRLLTLALLGPTQTSARVQHLERSRGQAVAEGDARLRQIERDLHDGTQARLVAVAMQLGEAREQLASGGDAAEALALLDTAHASTKDAMVELREIARSIHPPALDNGLAVALDSLAARSAVPVTVDVDMSAVPGPEVETIVYFCAAELLANVARHARASGAYVRLDEVDGALRLRVRDDGVGGAAPRAPRPQGGSGLAGLRDRVATVDGTLEVDSPPGGPTVVTVNLPLTVAG